jgi:hypothetical protein
MIPGGSSLQNINDNRHLTGGGRMRGYPSRKTLC